MSGFKLNSEWDICLSGNNIMMVDGDEEIAQNVASSVRIFKGELPFDSERGIAYNKPESLNGVLGFEIKEQAELVKDVESASVEFDNIENRGVSLTIKAKKINGQEIIVR